MTGTLTLVKMNEQQCQKIKEITGSRSKPTHALLCGSYGRLFGTEIFCRKYFSAWQVIFSELFTGSAETETAEIDSYKMTDNLVLKLIKAHDKIKK